MSGLAITSRPRPRQSLVQKFSRNVRHTHEKTYCSRLYYRSSRINSWEVFFVIMWDLELHITVSGKVTVATRSSLGTRPSNNRKEKSGKRGGVEVYTAEC